jgi:hypothetical protein
MIEHDVDMVYFHECEVEDELDEVLLHDECGEYDDITYYRKERFDRLEDLVRAMWPFVTGELRDDDKADIEAIKINAEIRDLGIEGCD